MSFLWATLLALILAAAWILTLVGLPGNWLMVAAAAIYAWLVPQDATFTIGPNTIIATVVLAIVGELAELVAGALGVAKAGGSRRSAVLALVGSVVGGFAGMFVGLPIPVVGSVLAAVLFAALGALAGAVLGENWKGRGLDHSVQVGKAAFWGRLLGTLAKTLLGSVIVAVVLAALVLP